MLQVGVQLISFWHVRRSLLGINEEVPLYLYYKLSQATHEY